MTNYRKPLTIYTLTVRRTEWIGEKAEVICGICKKPLGIKDWNIDHIISRANGGGNNIENLQITHKVCNGKKGSEEDNH